MPDVIPYTVPEAGVDTVEINLEETYTVEGVGSDTVALSGSLVANRGAPLVDPKVKSVEWETSTVVANFQSLDVRGESDVFGPVSVTLDPTIPSFGVVQKGKCLASLGVVVSMPKHDLVVRTRHPVQLHSQVKTVPPIGDERTESVGPVALIDIDGGREIGSLESAKVLWRELTAQVKYETNGNGAKGD
jgi:hypothetical protein